MNGRIVFGLVLCAGVLAAQPESMRGTPEARAEYAKGIEAQRSDWEGSGAYFRKAIELDPNFFDAHEQYVFVSTAGKNYNNEKLFVELEAQYQKWAKEHPDKAVYRYSLGHLYEYKKPDLAVQYFHEAVKLDPKFGPAWDMLGITAEAQGKLAEEHEYERKAAESWPENSRYAGHYVASFMMEDFSLFKKAALEFAAKFPDQAVGQLGYAAMRAPTAAESRGMYELIRQKYAAQGASRLEPLFQMYIREDPAKALALAEEMNKVAPADKQWPQLAAYAKAVIDASAMIKDGKAPQAVLLLDKVTLPPRTDRRMIDVTRAQALAASGQADAAYDSLLKSFAAKPNDEVKSALLAVAAKAGKDAKQVDAEVFAQRSATAKPGIPFASVTYPDRKPVSLASMKGKVYLLNFWYPMCGPCRGEFPSLQAILDKYKSRGFQIVAANGHPLEDAWVMPLITGWKLGFLPIHGDEEMAAAYKVRGYPSNFLYGPDGRIYYVPGPVNTVDARREFELQLEALLDQAQK